MCNVDWLVFSKVWFTPNLLRTAGARVLVNTNSTMTNTLQGSYISTIRKSP